MMTDLSDDSATRAELAPEGALRAGLVEAPSPGLIFVSRRPEGGLDGVTAILVADLAASLGLTLAPFLFPNSGAAAEALRAGAVDVAFMPVDETRRRMVAFGPGYYDLESTYLASAASGSLRSVARSISLPPAYPVTILNRVPSVSSSILGK